MNYNLNVSKKLHNIGENSKSRITYHDEIPKIHKSFAAKKRFNKNEGEGMVMDSQTLPK